MIVRLKELDGTNPSISFLNSFNSMIVRLKVHIHILKGSIRSCFNSMIVRLKVGIFPPLCSTFGSFNSMIVRLKDPSANIHTLSTVGFNSMIVRLKARRGVPPPLSNPQFQFYDSPIKRYTAKEYDFNTVLEFQFYDSPIKSAMKLIPHNGRAFVSIL